MFIVDWMELCGCEHEYDVLCSGVARAFGMATSPHPELVRVLTEYFGPDNLDSAKMKMAQVSLFV